MSVVTNVIITGMGGVDVNGREQVIDKLDAWLGDRSDDVA